MTTAMLLDHAIANAETRPAAYVVPGVSGDYRSQA
jgi:hypothetical protein